MSNKQQLFTGTMLATMLLASVTMAEGEVEQKSPSDRGSQVQSAAPILHRRTSLPAGWFKQGKVPGALTGTQVNSAQPVVHFDTMGPPSDGSSSAGRGPGRAADRLRQIRSSVILEDLPATAATTTTMPAATATPMSATNSSRRRVPDTPSATTPATANPSGPTAGVATMPDEAVDDAPVDNTDASSGPAADPAPIAESLPGVDELPSVMKRPALGHEPSPVASPVAGDSGPDEPGRMTLTTVESERPVAAVNTATVSPEPTLELGQLGQAEPPVVAESGEAVLIRDQSPVLSVVTRGPKTIVVGKTATFVVDLTNRSDFPAKDVVVRVNIPQWVEIVQQNPSFGTANIQPDDSGNAVLSWSLDRLNGLGQEKLILDLIPRGSRPLDLGVTWTISPARSTTQIQVQEPKLQLTVVGPQEVMYGETKVYTITVSNPGTGAAENVVLNLLPLIPSERTAGVRQLGTLAAGERRTVEVELTTRQTGEIHVRAEATADGGLLARGEQDVTVRRAALEVLVEGPPMKYAGTRARYVVRVANTGDAPAASVVVVATLPAGSKDVAASDGGSLDANSGQVEWALGTLRPGATRVLEMECMLLAAGENRVDLRMVASGDLSALGSTVTQVESLADLKLTVNDPQGAIAVGAEVGYEVRITNRGTKAAENIRLFGYFSEGIEPTGVSGWRGQLNEGEVVLQTIPRLAAGQEMMLRITAQASRPGDHVFRAELECNDPETKLAVEEWTRFYGEGPAIQQAARRPTRGPNTPVKELKIQR